MVEYLSDVWSTMDIDDECLLKADPSCFGGLNDRPKGSDYWSKSVAKLKKKKKLYIGNIFVELNGDYEISFFKKGSIVTDSSCLTSRT